MRKRIRKILKWTALVLLIIVSGLSAYIFANQHKQFDAPYPDIHASADSLVIERGRSLVFGAAHCANCHTPMGTEDKVNSGIVVPLSGGRIFDLPIGQLISPNLTPDETGIGRMTDQQIARALRYGVRANGEALFNLMPFHHTSDADLQAIISFLRSQPAVRNEVPANKMNFLGKIVKALLLKPAGPTESVPKFVRPDTTVEYGRYLANSIANCRGCHTERDLMTGAFTGPDYGGGLKFDVSTDSGKYSLSTPNLTPHATGRIAGWSQEQFIKRFRQGVLVPESHMPWGPFGRMSDNELKAIYKFLQTVTPVDRKVPLGLVKE